MPLFKLITILFLQLFACIALAEHKPSLQLFYITDEANKYDIEEVEKLYSQKKLKSTSNGINLSFEASNIWIRIAVDSLDEDKILTIQNAHLDSIELYIYSENKLIKKYYSGDHLDFNYRYINTNFFNFLIPEETKVIFLKVHTDGPMLVPVEILSYKNYFSFLQRNGILVWVFLGFIILILVSNILLYIWLRETINIYYCLFLLSIGILTALDFGYMFEYLWPHAPSFNQHIPFIYLLIFASALFTEKLLNIRYNSPFFYRIFQFLYLCCLLAGVIMIFSSYNTSVQIVFYFAFVIPLISFSSGIYLYAKLKNELSRFFLIGWSAFMTCVLIYMLSLSGIIKFNWVTGNIIQIGSIVEIMFFNLAILSRINLLKREKEIMMEDRSRELIKINMKLRLKNERLEQYAAITNHNLRGPVATLLGLCNIFNKSTETDKHNILVFEKIKDTMFKFDTIIKDLNSVLDLREDVESEIQAVDINTILREVKVVLNYDIEKSEAIITHDFSKISVIYAFEDYMKNIFYQLISNSIKFKRENISPEIHITTEEDNDHVYLVFKDNGLGIDLKKYKQIIFNPFKKLQQDIEGKGLGLYIIKREIEAMHGSIEIVSQPNKGSVFTIKLSK